MALNQWIKKLQSESADTRNRARKELHKLDPEGRTAAVPELVAALERLKDSAHLAGRIAQGLVALGTAARTAVPFLVSLVSPYGGWSTDPDTTFAVLQIGGDPDQERFAVRSLLQAEESRGYGDAGPLNLWRWQPVMQSCADRILPILSELLLTDPEWYVRYRALVALTGYDAHTPNLVATLVAALNDPTAGVRGEVALALSKVDPGRKSEAITALLALLPELPTLPGETPQQMSGYHIALPSLVSPLVALGAEPIPHILPPWRRHTGAAQIPYMNLVRDVGEPSLAALQQELKGSSVAGRVSAARTLGHFGSFAENTYEDLVAALQDPEAEVRTAAAVALVETNASRAGPAVHLLSERLRSADPHVRRATVGLLNRMRAAAVPALPALRALLADPELSLEAARAMVEIAPQQAVAAVSVLSDALLRPAPEDFAGVWVGCAFYDRHYWAPGLLKTLALIGPAATAAAPTVRQVMRSADDAVRVDAAWTLALIAPACTSEAVSLLIGVVETYTDPNGPGDFFNAGYALEALNELGPAAVEGAPRLEAVLFNEEKRPWSAPNLFQTLLKIDGTAEARTRVRFETDLKASATFARAAGFLNDLSWSVPSAWDPLVELMHTRAKEEEARVKSQVLP